MQLLEVHVQQMKMNVPTHLVQQILLCYVSTFPEALGILLERLYKNINVKYL